MIKEVICEPSIIIKLQEWVGLIKEIIQELEPVPHPDNWIELELSQSKIARIDKSTSLVLLQNAYQMHCQCVMLPGSS